jgi:hypothetical protein
MVAVAARRCPLARVRELRELAQTRADRLVLVPHDPAIADGQWADGLTPTLADLATVLRSSAS